MVDRIDFEAQLEARLQSRAAFASRPFDASEIAHKAIATGARRRGFGWLTWPVARPSTAWLVIVLLLVIALLGAITFAGALLRQRSRPSGVSNGWIAYAIQGGTRGTSGPSDIYLVGNGVDRRIIGSDGDKLRQVCPAFSPDGTRLAYSEGPDVPGVTPTAPSAVVIVTLGTDGLPVGPVVRFVAPSPGDVCPMWAPDGQSLAFFANPQDPQLWVARLDGTETQVAASKAIKLDGFPGQFDWSPDGTAIVAVGYDSASLWIVPVGAGQARLLPRGGAPTSDRQSDQEEPKWSPDGTRIAVVQTTWADVSGGQGATGTSTDVYRADGSGSPVELANDSSLGFSLAWSPNGKQLAAVRVTQPLNGPGQYDIVTLAPDASDERVIVTDDASQGWIRGLTWSPDGMRLVYAQDDAGSGRLISVAATGDPAPVALTRQPHDFEFTNSNNLSWQPVFP